MTIPTRGGKPHALTDCRDDCWSDGEARFSRDGKRVVFIRASGPRTGSFPTSVAVWVMNADGSGIRQLSSPPQGYEDHNPDWSPDGKTIVFARENSATMARKLIGIDAETGAEHVVYTFPSWAPGGGSATFSPDGGRLLFGFWCGGNDCPAGAYRLRNSRLATIRPDGTDLKVLPITPRADSGAWSPSGREIVFSCHAPALVSGTDFHLCTSRLDGTDRKQFPWPVESAHPSWGTHP